MLHHRPLIRFRTDCARDPPLPQRNILRPNRPAKGYQGRRTDVYLGPTGDLTVVKCRHDGRVTEKSSIVPLQYGSINRNDFRTACIATDCS